MSKNDTEKEKKTVKKSIKKKVERCSFCSREQKEVSQLICGVDGNICSDCVEVCYDILKNKIEDKDALADIFTSKAFSPKGIYKMLNNYVIGQEDAKKVLSVAVYNHYKRILPESKKNKELLKQYEDVELTKSNVLMLGSTGVGKTLLAKTLAKILDVPMVIVDATSLTEAGYVGDDVESILLRLLQEADFDLEKAEKGIIYIDEIDKIARKSSSSSLTRDVRGEGVQQALLKIIEGTVATVSTAGMRKHPQKDMIQINTNNILFICGGSFTGIEKVIEKRVAAKSIGFYKEEKDTLKPDNKKRELLPLLKEEDLFQFGFIPELIGRLPVIVTLNNHSEEDIYKILVEPNNAISMQYRKNFAIDGIDLEFSEEALRHISKEVYNKKLGARALRGYMENIFTNVTFDIVSKRNKPKKVVVDYNLKKCKIDLKVLNG